MALPHERDDRSSSNGLHVDVGEVGEPANGIGLADFTTRRLVEAIDRRKTFVNSITAISPEKAAVPLWLDTDRQVLAACAASLGRETLREARIVRIRDTASLELLQVSDALSAEAEKNPNLRALGPAEPLSFDPEGDLGAFPEAG